MTNPNIPALWSALRGMLARMESAIGAAAALAERAWIGRREQRRIRKWLAPLVAMARKIVLIEALALAALPAPRRMKRADAKASSTTGGERKPSLRLWPKPARSRPRARQLGPPLLVRDIWRDRAREAQARHLNKVRFMRPPPGVALARRIEALTRIVERPQWAIRRLAQRLRRQPKLALELTGKRMPRTRLYNAPEYDAVWPLCLDLSTAHAFPDTS